MPRRITITMGFIVAVPWSGWKGGVAYVCARAGWTRAWDGTFYRDGSLKGEPEITT
jgi:hypothetical protein